MRHLGVVLVVLAATSSLTACNMYAAKPQKMKAPAPIKPPKELPKDGPVVDAKPQMVLECEYRWNPTQPTRKPNVQKRDADERTGDDQVKTFSSSTNGPAKSTAITSGIEAYSRALSEDPFNAVITLKLALAYDKVHRQGCAIAMLQRLAKLSDHPKFARDANVTIDEVLDKKDYFKWYRNDAVRAVGR